jgi:hypothetical protein
VEEDAPCGGRRRGYLLEGVMVAGLGYQLVLVKSFRLQKFRFAQIEAMSPLERTSFWVEVPLIVFSFSNLKVKGSLLRGRS